MTIPVMAKARIGHFVEAQVLEALEVDYIDESEVLTPADEAHHIDKSRFKVPFVCGATNLGEALRRIAEGAAMIRSQGRGRHRERGRGGAPHARDRRRDPPARVARRGPSCPRAAKELAGAARARARRRREGAAPGRAVLRRGHRHPGRRGADDAARRRGRVRRLGHLQVRGPERTAAAVVEATTHFEDAERGSQPHRASSARP